MFSDPEYLDARAYDALWDVAVAVQEALERVDAAPLGWSAVRLGGMPTASLAFILEHLSYELERILQKEGNHAK